MHPTTATIVHSRKFLFPDEPKTVHFLLRLDMAAHTHTHTHTHTHQFLQAGCPSCRPTNSVEALLKLQCISLLKQVQLPTSAVNVTLHAFATERRAAALLLVRRSAANPPLHRDDTLLDSAPLGPMHGQ